MTASSDHVAEVTSKAEPVEDAPVPEPVGGHPFDGRPFFTIHLHVEEPEDPYPAFSDEEAKAIRKRATDAAASARVQVLSRRAPDPDLT